MEQDQILIKLKSKFLNNEFEIAEKILKDIEKEVLVCEEDYEEGIKFTGNFYFGIGIEPQIILYLNNIDDFYNFKHAILPSGQLERKLNKICVAKKQLNIDISPDFSAELSTNSGFMSDSNES